MLPPLPTGPGTAKWTARSDHTSQMNRALGVKATRAWVQNAWWEYKWEYNNHFWQHFCPLIYIYIYIYIYIHTHTHTHVGFYGLRGLSIGVMVFILYKLYVLLPYTYPTPKLSPHRRRCISIFPQKNSLCMIYKRFKLWRHWKCPHKSPSPCNTCVIPMSLYKFVSS